MKRNLRWIWTVALLVALTAIVFPPRRDTEGGLDREGIPSRRFLWSADLYQGSLAIPDVHLVARIDLEKLATELLALAALGGALTLLSYTFERRTSRCTEPLPRAAVS